MKLGQRTLSLRIKTVFFLTRGITRPISSLARATAQVAGGDLTQKVTLRSRDEIGLLAQSFQGMVTGLHDLVLQVRQGADEVQSASGQIATTAEQGARGSEGTAAAGKREDTAGRTDSVEHFSGRISDGKGMAVSSRHGRSRLGGNSGPGGIGTDLHWGPHQR